MAKPTASQDKDELLTIEELAARALKAEQMEMDDSAGMDDDTVADDDDDETDDAASVAEEASAEGEMDDSSGEEQKSAIQQLKDFVDADEEHAFKFNFNIKALVGGDGLSRVIAKNWFFICVVVFFTCCYVTTRYMMQSAMLENDALTDTLIDRRYKALTLSSELLEHTLSSQIEQSLQDSTIHTPSDQAFSLKTE